MVMELVNSVLHYFVGLLRCRIILDEVAHDAGFMFCPVNAQMVCSLLIWWSYSTQQINMLIMALEMCNEFVVGQDLGH